MKCPNCGLINPDSALRCDCGYDFNSSKIEKSYIPKKQKGPKKYALGIFMIILGSLFGLSALYSLSSIVIVVMNFSSTQLVAPEFLGSSLWALFITILTYLLLRYGIKMVKENK
jgi:hypothetical protein